MPEKKFEEKIHFLEDLSSPDIPKISIHESGQVHLVAGQDQIGPLQIPHLSDLRGQHIATIVVDDFSNLSKLTTLPKLHGKDIDHIIPIPEEVKGGRLVFYIAGDKPAFEAQDFPMVVSMARKTLSNPLYIGIKTISQGLMGEPEARGIMVIAGWDPTGTYQQGADFIYIRGL